MTKEIKKLIRRIYSVALSGTIVIAGFYLISACIHIYRSGDAPFSRESVAAAFAGIAFPVYACLLMILGGFVLGFLIPDSAAKAKPQKQYSLILRQLHQDLPQFDSPAVCAEQNKRKVLRCVTAGLIVIESAVFLSYALDSSHFSQTDITGSMIKAMWVLLPCLAVPFGFGIFTVYSCRQSMRREIDLLKQEGAKTHRQTAVPAKAKSNSIRWGILAVAAIILIYGFFAGGTMDVLTKAINICTECVGLG